MSIATAERVASNVWLLLVQRLSALAMVPLLGLAWLYLESKFDLIDAKAMAAANEASETATNVAGLTVRMTAVEVTISEGRRLRDGQLDTLTDLVRGQSAQLAQLTRDQTTTLATVARLESTVTGLVRDADRAAIPH